jgi:eukaryotic-like serine/threonine-protein kinase
MTSENRGRVLLVDDEPVLLEIMAETLQEAGFLVETARDGREALARIEAREPDVVVADVEMGGMGGYELCRQVRASGRDAIPFLFCSGQGSEDSRVEGLQAGADDYLVKPVRRDELILKLARQVERVRTLRRAASAAGPPPVTAATLTAIETRLSVQGSPLVRLGRFEMRAILGRGSMGTVFKAWDTKLERWVAIKTVRAGAGMAEWDGDVVRGLVAEAAIVARFNHPHVVAVHDVCDATDAAYIVMELVDGPSLEEVLRHRRLLPARAVPLLQALASALAAAHGASVLHRDVKPGNVLLGHDGAIKLTDFGIASFVSSRMGRSLFGTPGYMPPETLRGRGFDRSGDLFALGAIAYRCLTGAPAFGGPTTADILTSTLKRRVPPLRESCADAPVELEALVAGLLEPDSERRLADAALVARQLARMAASHGWRWTAPVAGEAEAPVDDPGGATVAPHAQVLDTVDSDDVPED